MGALANLATVEVKACGLPGKKPTKDGESLVAFIEEAEYFRGIALLFGGTEARLNGHIRRAFGPAAHMRERILLYWHQGQGQAAIEIENWWARL